MRNLILPLLLCCATIASASAQVLDSSCATHLRRIFYYAEKGAQFTGSLDDYFKKALPEKTDVREGKSTFKIRLVIDSAGKLCCTTIDSNSTRYTSQEIRSCIDGMPAWRPAIQNGHAVTFCVMMEVAFDKGTLTVTYKNEHPIKVR